MEHKEQSEYIDVFFKGIDAGFYKMIMPYEVDFEVFDLELSFGCISDIKNYDSRIAGYRTLFPVFTDVSFNKDVLNGIGRFIINGRLDALKNTDKKIRIWASKRASDELCGLYFLCSELSDKDLYLVDIPMNGDCLFNNMDVSCYLTDSPKCLYRDLNDGYYLNFHKNIVFDRISLEKKEEYAKKWQKLVEEDGDLRTYDRGAVTTYYYDDFYETILKIVGTSQFLKYGFAADHLISLNGSYDLNINQIHALISDMTDKGIFVELGEKDIDQGYPAVDRYLIANRNYLN